MENSRVKPLNSHSATRLLRLTLPFQPKDQNLNSYLLPLFISYRSSGKKLTKYQANSSLCDHVSNSHDHSVLQTVDIARRNLMLITLGA